MFDFILMHFPALSVSPLQYIHDMMGGGLTATDLKLLGTNRLCKDHRNWCRTTRGCACPSLGPSLCPDFPILIRNSARPTRDSVPSLFLCLLCCSASQFPPLSYRIPFSLSCFYRSRRQCLFFIRPPSNPLSSRLLLFSGENFHPFRIRTERKRQRERRTHLGAAQSAAAAAA